MAGAFSERLGARRARNTVRLPVAARPRRRSRESRDPVSDFGWVIIILAFDWYFPPSLRHFNAATTLVLGLLLVMVSAVGAFAALARRRATGSEQARGILADEQAALRRVATLVARQPSAEEVFAAVTEEVGRLLGLDGAHLHMYERDGTATVVGAWALGTVPIPLGSSVDLDGDNVAAAVFRTGKPAESTTTPPPRAQPLRGCAPRVCALRSALLSWWTGGSGEQWLPVRSGQSRCQRIPKFVSRRSPSSSPPRSLTPRRVLSSSRSQRSRRRCAGWQHWWRGARRQVRFSPLLPKRSGGSWEPRPRTSFATKPTRPRRSWRPAATPVSSRSARNGRPMGSPRRCSAPIVRPASTATVVPGPQTVR